MAYNNIEAVLSPTQQQEIIAQIQAMKESMPFLVSLSTKEKHSGRRTHNYHSFRSNALEMASYNQELLPPSQPYSAWAKDEELLQSLTPILQALNIFRETLEDTILALRMESQKSSMNFLRLARMASAANVPGTDTIVKRLEEAMGK
ncbi:MAG: hypothetical protein JNJ58_09350 [Chitinophagaceae bacterium]|nr:hypothetical protein [Chitinophagaceae bacterium]